jgi:hypothetical protein
VLAHWSWVNRRCCREPARGSRDIRFNRLRFGRWVGWRGPVTGSAAIHRVFVSYYSHFFSSRSVLWRESFASRRWRCGRWRCCPSASRVAIKGRRPQLMLGLASRTASRRRTSSVSSCRSRKVKNPDQDPDSPFGLPRAGSLMESNYSCFLHSSNPIGRYPGLPFSGS